MLEPSNPGTLARNGLCPETLVDCLRIWLTEFLSRRMGGRGSRRAAPHNAERLARRLALPHPLGVKAFLRHYTNVTSVMKAQRRAYKVVSKSKFKAMALEYFRHVQSEDLPDYESPASRPCRISSNAPPRRHM